MTRARWIALGLLSCLSAGCFTERDSRISRLRSMSPATNSDAIYVDYLIVERPVGDQILDQKIWNDVDEMVISVDARPYTKGNGFRIGVIGGLISPEVQTLIKNPKNSQGIRRRQFQPDLAKSLPIGGAIAECEFQVLPSGEEKKQNFKLEQAQCMLSIIPTAMDGGKIRLEFVPEIQFVDKKQWLPPGAVGAGWLREKPTERFSTLGWEVNLAPSEYLLLGTWYESQGTLGSQFFTGETNKLKVQKLLILRAGRVSGAASVSDFFAEEIARKGKSLSLAQQASSSSARALKP